MRVSELKERSASQNTSRTCADRSASRHRPRPTRPARRTASSGASARTAAATIARTPGSATPSRGSTRAGGADLDAAFGQLRQYALTLKNPPLLIVSDMRRFRIRTNWTNSVSKSCEFDLDDPANAAPRDRLKRAFSDPERLRAGETRQSLTERAAASFATVAQALRDRGRDPHRGAHFVNRLVFCMFADDVGPLPEHMFYWFEKAGRQIVSGRTPRAGLVATNSIRGGANRRALEAATSTSSRSDEVTQEWSRRPIPNRYPSNSEDDTGPLVTALNGETLSTCAMNCSMRAMSSSTTVQ